MDMYVVYMLVSLSNRKCYVGYTQKDPNERLHEHNIGSNSWTRANGPFRLAYYETYVCKEDALRRELFYKSGIGRRIRNIIVKEMIQ